MPALSPGIYLVGCEDGSVYPLIVTVTAKGSKVAGDKTKPGYAAAGLALKRAGFWWRRMVVPGVMPPDTEMDGLPPIRRIPEDL